MCVYKIEYLLYKKNSDCFLCLHFMFIIKDIKFFFYCLCIYNIHVKHLTLNHCKRLHPNNGSCSMSASKPSQIIFDMSILQILHT